MLVPMIKPQRLALALVLFAVLALSQVTGGQDSAVQARPRAGQPFSANTVQAVRALTGLTATPTVGISQGLTVNPPQGGPGATVSLVSAPGALQNGSTVTLYFQDPLPANPPVQIGTASVVSNGQLVVPAVTLPAAATAGAATITAVSSGNPTLSGTFSVLTTLVVTPTVVSPGATMTVTGSAFAAFNTISLTLNGSPVVAVSGQTQTDHLGGFSAGIALPATLALGTATLQASDGVHAASVSFTVVATPSPTVTATATITPTVTPVPGTATLLPTAPPLTATPTTPPVATPTAVYGTPISSSTATTAYFAEGYTGTAKTNGRATFTEVIDVLNPNPVPAAVTFTYYVQGRTAPVTVHRMIPARTAYRESVNTDVGPDAEVATVLTSPARIYAVRTITRTSPAGARLDGSTTLPVAAPATTWDFAEGYTGVTFQEYLTILNPSSSAAQVTIRLAPQATTASTTRTLTVTVPPQSRATANIRALNAGNVSASVGMLVSSTQPIVAERVEYFGDGNGSGKYGSTVASGVAAPASLLHIGFGSSGGTTTISGTTNPAGDQQYITLLNAATSGAPIPVTVSFTGANGQTVGHAVTVSVAAGTRNTVIANDALGAAPAGPFSVSVSGGAGVIQAEAAQYFGGSPNIGRHPGVALPALASPAATVYFAGLATQLPDGSAVNRTIYLYNPSTTAVQVATTFYSAGGLTASTTTTVQPGSIGTVNVNQQVPLQFGSGPIGAVLQVSSPGSILASAIGRTADGLAAFAETGAPGN
jgi:hypothetical protein